MVKVTNNDNFKKERLLQFLRSNAVPMGQLSRGGESGVLHIVARTTCSCRLAEYLLDRGADANYRHMGTAATPLFEAASNDSAEFAALTKLLLLRGANPETITAANRGPSGNRIKTTMKVRDQKGAKGIAKWLGMTWDELIVDVQRQRKETGLKI